MGFTGLGVSHVSYSLWDTFAARRRTMETIKKFLKDESGMETLEYAVIAGLIAAVGVLVYASGWGNTLVNRLTAASNTQ
jgi:Flp pilus assembly pilin Flp